jgi:peptide/nickel transport system substrate-binding protein
LFLDRADWKVNADMPTIWAWQLEIREEDGEVLTRNPYYWKVDTESNQIPYMDHLETRVAANSEVAGIMAMSGEADFAAWAIGQYPQDTMLLKNSADQGGYQVLTPPISEPNVCAFGLNLTVEDEGLREIFRDRRFRIALSHAIDREQIRQLVYLGQPKETRQCAPLRDSAYYHDAAAQNYVEYNTERANELLDEVGLTDRDGDGFRLRPNGDELSIVIEIIGDRDDFIDDMEMVADFWNAVGIKAVAKPVEKSLYFERLRANQLQAGVDYCQGGLFPPLFPRDFVPVDNTAVWAPEWGRWYATAGETGEEPPEEVKKQQELYGQSLVSVDQQERIDLWNQILDINAENMYNFGICDRAGVPHVFSNQMRNVPESGWDCGWEGGSTSTARPYQWWKEA